MTVNEQKTNNSSADILDPTSPYAVTPQENIIAGLRQLSAAPDLNASLVAKKAVPDTNEPSIDDQLKAIELIHKKIATESKSKYTANNDPDESKKGFNKSDKIGMIGSLLVSGKMGVEETFARIKQLGLKGAEAAGIIKDGESQKFTDWFNKKESQARLYHEALISHPTISAIGNFGGSLLPSLAIPGGAIEDLVSNASLKFGASNLLTKVLARSAVGATIGEMQYDPTNSNSSRQAIGGALASLALPAGGKLVKAISRPVARELQQILDKHGIAISPYPRFENLISSLPFSGIKENMQSHLNRINEIGQKMAGKIIDENSAGDDYGSILHGEIKSSYLANKEQVGRLNDKMSELAGKRGDAVDMSTLRTHALDAASIEQNLPESHQNKSYVNKMLNWASTPNVSFNVADELRKRIGQNLNILNKGALPPGTSAQEAAMLKSMYGAIKNDINNYAEKAGGEIKELHDKSDKLYIDKILPFQRGKYRAMIAPDYDTDQFLGHFLSKDKSIRASQLLDLMPKGSKKGLFAARSAILQNALDRAKSPKDGDFNAFKFVNEALRLGKVNKVLFSPEQQKTMAGYKKLLQTVYKYAPSTFQPEKAGNYELRHLLHWGGLGALMWHPHLAAAVLTSGIAASRLLTNDAARKLLIKISAKSGELSQKEMNPMIKKLMSTAIIATSARIGRE